jgi:hypothetical protein
MFHEIMVPFCHRIVNWGLSDQSDAGRVLWLALPRERIHVLRRKTDEEVGVLRILSFFTCVGLGYMVDTRPPNRVVETGDSK